MAVRFVFSVASVFSYSDSQLHALPFISSQYRFQHEDLIRKREKIQQQNNSLEAAALQRNRRVLDVRRRLDRQRNKYQELKQTEEQESENLLTTMLSLASREKIETHTPKEANDIDNTQAQNGTDDEATDQKELSRSNTGDFDLFLKDLEEAKEAALFKEFKTNIDYEMLPKMITQKTHDLKTEAETMLAEISQLEAMLYGTATAIDSQEQGQGQGQHLDTKPFVPSEITFGTDVSNDVGQIETMQTEFTGSKAMLHGAKRADGSQEQEQESETVVPSESTLELDVGNGIEETETLQTELTPLEKMLHGTTKANGSQEQEQERQFEMFFEVDEDNDVDEHNPEKF